MINLQSSNDLSAEKLVITSQNFKTYELVNI